MRKRMGLLACAMAVALGARASGEGAPAPRPPIDLTVLHAQVILDHLGFAPGILDGRGGRSLVAALKGFQEVRGIPETGTLDQRTLAELHPYRALRPIRWLAVTPDAIGGPFVPQMPKDPQLQAKLPALAYRDGWEKLAEMFHTTPEVLHTLNPRGELRPGAKLVFPDALPVSRAYPVELDSVWRQTLSDLNVDADEPQGARIVVDKSDKVLRVYDADDRLVAQFSATMGSEHDPLPIGRWTIQGKSYNPKFHYNPELFWDAKKSATEAMLPAGPNGPVGVVWLDLSKPHYGIHGTPEPQSIGRSESHGCIRLTNWDVARLSLMVKAGTPVEFQE